MNYNPVFQREFLAQLRVGRAWVLRAVVAAALCALVLLRWPDDARVDLAGAESRRVLQVFGYGLLAVLVMIVPVAPAVSVVLERRSGTLALLLNSPLTRLELLLGKLGGSLGNVLVTLALSLPAVGACFAMGGVDLTREVLPLYLVFVLVGVELSLVGLVVSARMATVDGALRTTYLAVVLLVLGPLAPHRFLRPMASGEWAVALDWLREISPVPAVMTILGHGDVAGAGLVDAGSPVLRHVLVSCVVCAVLLGLGLMGLRQTMLDRPRGAGRATDERSTRARVFRRIMFLWFFDPQRRSSLIGNFTNPVLVKELRSSRLGRSYWLMRLMLGSLMASLALVLAVTRLSATWMSSSRGASLMGGILALLQMSLITILTPVLASNIIAGERESQRWQLLQLTSLSPVRIVTGKFAAVLMLLTLVLAASLPAYGVLMLIDPEIKEAVPKVLVTLVLTSLFAVAVSGAASSLFRQTVRATTAAFTVLLGIMGGTLLLWLGEGQPFSRTTVERVLSANPLAAALSAMGTAGFEGYDILHANWIFLGVGTAVSLVILGICTWRLSRPV